MQYIKLDNWDDLPWPRFYKDSLEHNAINIAIKDIN